MTKGSGDAQQIGGAIATALVTPHMILVVLQQFLIGLHISLIKEDLH